MSLSSLAGWSEGGPGWRCGGISRASRVVAWPRERGGQEGKPGPGNGGGAGGGRLAFDVLGISLGLLLELPPPLLYQFQFYPEADGELTFLLRFCFMKHCFGLPRPKHSVSF